jgi:hypothetical protein
LADKLKFNNSLQENYSLNEEEDENFFSEENIFNIKKKNLGKLVTYKDYRILNDFLGNR